MIKKDFSKRIIVGVTAKKGKGWKEKLKEIKKYKIKEFAVFVEEIKNRKTREKVYLELLKMNIKEIPLVHIREDMDKEEIEFFIKNFKTKYFTIHEDHFQCMKNLKGFYKKLYLEMNYDNFIPKKVNVKKIGGFCIDLSHFKAGEERYSKEFIYIIKRQKTQKYFKCNHINGFDYKKNTDKHIVEKLGDFNYLKTLPSFLFGKVIAIETYNPIKEQIKFRKYLIKLLNNKFNKK